MSEFLSGGRDNQIVKCGNIIKRPSQEWTENVHKFLRFLHERGFDKVPFPHESNKDGNEIVSYLDGIVYNDLLPEKLKTDEIFISVAKLLREFHDHGSDYIKQLTGNEKWMLGTIDPIETMCHSDFAPYNIVVNNDLIAGIIDFDTLHPGPKIWDIAYALYRWVPLMHTCNVENFGSETDKKRRLIFFCNSYGLEDYSISTIIAKVVIRLKSLVSYMENESEKKNQDIIQNIEEGHLKTYLQDINYLQNLEW